MIEKITVDTVMDKKIFFRFAVFDGLIRQRRWLSPLLFSGIFCLFACACFFMRESAEQAVMLGCVLLAVGLGLPLFYFLAFTNSIRLQIKKHGLSRPQRVYSLSLTRAPDGITVKNLAGEQAKYEWSRLHCVYRVKGCTYLYVLSNKAFLLPDAQVAEGVEELLLLLSSVLPPEKLRAIK